MTNMTNSTQDQTLQSILFDQESTTALVSIQSKIDELDTKTNAIVDVPDESSAKQALSIALQSRKLKSSIEESRKQIVRPHIDFQKSMKKLCDDFNQKLSDMEDYLHLKIDQWLQKENDQPFFKTDSVDVEDGSLYTKKWINFHITEPEKVPLEYLSVDEKKIEEAIKSGVRNIPGVDLQPCEGTFLRVKNK